MFKIILNGNKINAIAKDKITLEATIKEYINVIAPDALFSKAENGDMVVFVLKRLLVKKIDEDVTIEENKGYIVEVVIDNDIMMFSLAKLNNEKVGNGYTIALTLQG